MNRKHKKKTTNLSKNVIPEKSTSQARMNPTMIEGTKMDLYEDIGKIIKKWLKIGGKNTDVYEGPLCSLNIHSVPLNKMVHTSLDRYGLVLASQQKYKPFTSKPSIKSPIVYVGFHHGSCDDVLQACILEFLDKGGKFDFKHDGNIEDWIKHDLVDDESYMIMRYEIDNVSIKIDS